jgi:methylglutaconyl-CoA hydratase
MTEMTLAATEWKIQIGLKIKGFTPVLGNQVELDIDIAHFTAVSLYNPEALTQMKKIIWEGTEDWDVLLKRAAISGELVLSDFTKMLNQFKKIIGNENYSSVQTSKYSRKKKRCD